MDPQREAALGVGDNVKYHGTVCRVADVYKGPSYVEGEFVVTIEHPMAGTLRVWSDELE